MNEVKKRGAKTPNQVAFDLINTLKKNKSMIIKNNQWKLVTLPWSYILRTHLNREFKVQTLKNDSGWLITALSE